MTLSEALLNVPSEPEWIWGGYIAAGAITAFSAAPKLGKSTTLFGLFRAIALGEPFIGLATRKTGVLLLTEERAQSLADKRALTDVDGDSLTLLFRHDAGLSDWEQIVWEATAYCHEHSLGVLVVDTWDKWAPLADENSPGDHIAALLPLMKAAETGLAIVIVHHHRKSPGSNGDQMRGSNALAGGVDVLVEMYRPAGPDKTLRRLEAVGRFSSTPAELFLRLVDGRFEAVSDVMEAVGDVIESQLLAAVEEGISDVDALAELVSVSKKTATKHLRELEADEKVKQLSGSGVKGRPLSFLPWNISGSFHLSTYPEQTSLDGESGVAE